MQPSPWGDTHLDLSFAGMQFRIDGLAQAQCKPILARYGLQQSLRDGAPATHTTIYARKDHFPRREWAHYNDPVYGYRHQITARDDNTLDVAGRDYRGTIHLKPHARGTLYTNTPEEAAQPDVFENFLRILSAILALQKGGLLLHSAGIVLDGRAFICLGRSGAGKSTLAGKALAAGATILSDDANMLLPASDGFEAGPVPFAGDLGQVPCTDGRAYPVAGLLWLHQDSELAQSPLPPALAFSRLMACAPTANALASLGAQLDAVLLNVLEQLPMRQLHSRREDSFEAIRGRINEAFPP